MQPGMKLAAPKELHDVFLLLQQRLGNARYALFFQDKTTIEAHGTALRLFVSSQLLLNWMSREFRAVITDVAREVMGSSATVEFLLASANGAACAENASLSAAVKSEVASSGDREIAVVEPIADNEEAGAEAVVHSLVAATRHAYRATAADEIDSSSSSSQFKMSRRKDPSPQAVAKPHLRRDSHDVDGLLPFAAVVNRVEAVSAPRIEDALDPRQLDAIPAVAKAIDRARSSNAAASETSPAPKTALIETSATIRTAAAPARRSTAISTNADKPRPSASNTTASGAVNKTRRPLELSDFVVGASNELASTAAAQLTRQCPAPFNPLYVFGGVGTGKTHLLEGIARQLRRTHPGQNVLMLTAEMFANHFTQALRDKTLPSFRQKFRNLDVLIVDDVEFFDNKRVISEEFLHTFTELVERGRQVVVSADRHPRMLSRLGDDLVTRFMSGLVCRLEAPDAELRTQFVQLRAARSNANISPEALQWVAQKFKHNFRELEGALHSLQTYFAMTEKRVTLNGARQILSDLERDCLKVVRLSDVEQTICTMFGIKPRDLKSDSRARTVSQPRMLAMYFARKHTNSAYQEIGQHFGGRNHSTVMAAEKKIAGLMEINAPMWMAGQEWPLQDLIDTIEQQLLAS